LSSQYFDDVLSAEADMIDDMGIFRIRVGVGALAGGGEPRYFDEVMVDTGSEFSWLPAEALADLGVVPVGVERFETADGRILERHIGYAMTHAGGRSAPDIVVFAGPADMILLGAHSLEGLRMRVDLARKELVPAGPAPAAAAA
jgi:predicted aspartyl protease